MRIIRTTTASRRPATTTTRHHALRASRVETSLVPAAAAHTVTFVPWDEPMARELDSLLSDLAGLDRLDEEITRLDRLAAEAN